MRPSPIARSLHLALALFGSFAGLLGSVALVSFAAADNRVGAALYSAVYCVYLGAGVAAWWRRPGNRFGAIIVIGGFAIWGAGFSNATDPALLAVGAVCATVVLAVLLHLLLAFPSGRVRGSASRVIVIVAYANSILLQAPNYLFAPDAESMLSIADVPWIVAAADSAQRLLGLLLTLGTAVVLVRRLRDADSEHRRVLVPLFAYGMFAVLSIPFSTGVLEGMLGVSAWARGLIQLAVLGGVPIAFTWGMLRGGFARAAGLSGLGSWIGSGGGERSTLGAALAHTVGDPGLVIAYWVHDRGIHIDEHGATVQMPPPHDRRAAIDVELDGRRVGAVIYDTALIAKADEVRDAAGLAAIAIDRQRLTAELHASERALAESRARIERADAAELDAQGGISQLTKRQREVLALVAQGRSNGAIARELVLTEKSVVNHVSRIFDVLDLPVDDNDNRRVRATIRFLAR